MKAITIHLDESIVKIIEQRRGLKQRTVYIRDLINSHCLKVESAEFSGDPQETLMELSHLKNELENRNTRISDLQAHIKNLEQQIGFLTQDHVRISGQLDRLLMPSHDEIVKKNWWQFWR
jgi:seryl-tRNA synthetase